MKSIKEKKLLVKWSKAMNEPIDPAVVEEVENYERLQKEIINSVRINTINDLSEASRVADDLIKKIIEYPKPPTLEEVLEVFKEDTDELVQSQTEQTIQTAEPESTESTEVPEPTQYTKTLADFAVEHITKEVKLEERADSFQQPDPALVDKNLEAIQKKLKFLEQAIGKIAATGPGSGSYWLYDLGDTNFNSVKNPASGDVLTFNSSTGKWEAAAPTGGAGSAANITIQDEGTVVTSNVTSINFVGSGVAVSNTGVNSVDVTITSSGFTPTDVKQIFAEVKNGESFTITKGQAVYLYAATGNRASVKLARNTGDPTSAKTLGLVYSDSITSGGTGLIITQGVITGVDTKDFSDGNTLYLANTAGNWTSIKPYAPEHLVYIGVVERANQGQGQIYVRPQNGYELNEIHDVNINHNVPLASNHLIVYNSTLSIWENRPVTYLGLSTLVNGSDTLSLDGANKVNLPGGTAYIFSATNNITLAPDSTGSNYLEIINNTGVTLSTDRAFEIRTNADGTDKVWTFSQGGALFFPDSTYQTTAFTGTAIDQTARNTANLAYAQANAALNTSNVVEGSNLYFSNARVYSNVISLGYITSSFLSGYATNAQLTSYATTANLALKSNIADLTTANVTELTNLYYTNARVYANVTSLAYARTADLTTANVIEVTNLYFTNARATTAVTNSSLSNITIGGQANVIYTPAIGVGGAINISAANTKGGAGYADFLVVTNTSGGATNPSKFFRLSSSGGLEIINSAYTSTIATISDNGLVGVKQATGVSNNTPVYNAFELNSHSFVFDDGNMHLNTNDGSIWLNSNDGSPIQLNIQMPSGVTSQGINVGGAIKVAGKQAVNGPAFSAYANSSAQTISTDTNTKVLFQVEEFDTNSNYSSSRFTPTIEGYYQLNASVRMDGTSGTGECMVMIYKNGNVYKRGHNASGTEQGASFYSMEVSSVVYANGSTDYFEIYVRQGSAGNRGVTAVNDASITYFNGCMLRGA